MYSLYCIHWIIYHQYRRSNQCDLVPKTPKFTFTQNAYITNKCITTTETNKDIYTFCNSSGIFTNEYNSNNNSCNNTNIISTKIVYKTKKCDKDGIELRIICNANIYDSYNVIQNVINTINDGTLYIDAQTMHGLIILASCFCGFLLVIIVTCFIKNILECDCCWEWLQRRINNNKYNNSNQDSLNITDDIQMLTTTYNNTNIIQINQ